MKKGRRGGNNFIDLVGMRFGRLTVIELSQRKSHGNLLWLCHCDCGGSKEVTGCNLKSGNSTSCGCFKRENVSKTFLRHGQSRSGATEYGIWKGMRKRCNNINSPRFKDYGGRGIAVYDRWRDFENFYADMGPRPSLQHSIDRIDVDGNYEPDNCRWATHLEQRKNRRKPKK